MFSEVAKFSWISLRQWEHPNYANTLLWERGKASRLRGYRAGMMPTHPQENNISALRSDAPAPIRSHISFAPRFVNVRQRIH